MKKSLKHAIQDKLETITLDEKQLNQLAEMQSSQQSIVKTSKAKNDNKPRFWLGTALAALVISMSLFTYFSIQPSSSEMIQRIANEVAQNHLKMKPMEVKTANMSELQHYFTKLDFLPQPSQQLSQQLAQQLSHNSENEIQLAGGRYCSIQSSTAAQLRYKNKQGAYVTLFETPYDPKLFKQIPNLDKGEEPITTYSRGIKVKLWVERGLLMVSTEKP